MNNTYATFQNQHEWYRRLSDIDETYHKLIDKLDGNPELYGGLFAHRCHSAYLGACRLALSGQVPETFMLLRGCLEAALYGLYIVENPDSRQIWHNRHKNDQCRKALKTEFAISNLKRCLANIDSDVHARLSKYYEYTIDLGGHPNIWSVESHIDDIGDSGPLVLNYLHPLSNVLLAAFKTCAVVGITGLDVFRHVFPQLCIQLELNNKLVVLKRGL